MKTFLTAAAIFIAISLTARSMGRVDKSIRAKFKMPQSGTDRDAISTARQFAEQAQAMKDEFVAHQMDPGFIDELNAALGVARSISIDKFLSDEIFAAQKDLIVVMGELATAPGDRERC